MAGYSIKKLLALTLLCASFCLPAVAQPPKSDFPDTHSIDEYGWKHISPNKIYRAQYPRMAANRFQEGWVHMGYDIDIDGKVRAPFVVASYPPGIFEESSLKALRKWSFPPPGEGDDYSFPTKRQLVFTFKLDGADGIRPSIRKKLNQARESFLEKKDFKKAQRQFEDLLDTDKTGWLTFYELAALELSRGLFTFAKADYGQAVVHSERALSYGDTLEEQNIIEIYRILFMSYFRLEKYEDTARVYDTWLELDPRLLETEFGKAASSIRSSIGG